MMAIRALLLAAFAGICLRAPQTEAHRLASDVADASACRGASQALAALQDQDDDLHKKLKACTRPLLFLGYKYLTAEQSKAYCKSKVCKELVVRLQEFPECMWTDLPSDSANELLTAHRVLQDCT